MVSNEVQDTHWLVIQNNETILLTQNHTLLTTEDVAPLSPVFLRQFSLGCVDSIGYCCAEIPAAHVLDTSFKAVSLRSALSLLASYQFAMAVKAYSVIRWDGTHQFCGRCGARTHYEGKLFERICLSCHLSFFPRISPSIIVLIHKEEQVVMARSPHFLPGIYGLIAGFVEVGESIEDTVHREVYEEIGLKIKNVHYVGSQPWPFPDSLMLAFTAEYESGDIVIDGNEIEEAGWYRYDQLPGRPSMSVSIGSMLLDDFVRRCHEKYS